MSVNGRSTRLACIARSAIFYAHLQSVFLCFSRHFPRCQSRFDFQATSLTRDLLRSSVITTISLFTFHTRKFLLLHINKTLFASFPYSFRVSSTNILIFSQHTCSPHNISSRLLQFAMKPNLPPLRPSKRPVTQTKLLLYSRRRNYFSKPLLFKVCSVNEAYCWFVVGINSTSSHRHEHSQRTVCADNDFLHNSLQICSDKPYLSRNMCSVIVFHGGE